MTTRTLDYGTNSPFSGVFGRPRSLSWPVDAYRITIPATLKSGQGQLNPFERVILGLIDAVGALDESLLADETCIPVDLVRSVLLRLRDRGLIDDDNRIVDRQRRNWEGDADEHVYTSALVFRELVGGKLLPFVHVSDVSNPIKTKETDAKARTLQPQYSARNLGAPSTREVIDAIVQMTKRLRAQDRVARIPTIEQIRVEREPEGYLLDCRIAVQTRDAYFRIADPFGMGFSRVLEGVFDSRLIDDQSLQTWMAEWLHSLANPKPDDREPVSVRASYDTPENRRRYPNLIQALTPSRGSNHRSVTNIYAALEWSLFYTCEAHNPSIAIRQLGAETGPTYSERLSQVAIAVGFDPPQHGFRPIPNGRFEDYENQKAEMETVLAIALMQAVSDLEHPMHVLAESHPDFIARIRELASDRGDRAHGAYVSLTSEAELDSDVFMRGVVSTLLPAVRFDDGASGVPRNIHADLLLDARASLLDAFGFQPFAKLGPDTQNALLEAERFWLVAEEGDDAREFVLSLYAALQGVLRSFLGGAAPLGLTEREYKESARDRARRAGLGDLPPGIETVNPRRIREALQGRDISVGASVLALLLTSTDGRLAALAQNQRTFLADVEVLQERRGHGNEPIPTPKVDIRKLRQTAFTTLVTLLDLTDGG